MSRAKTTSKLPARAIGTVTLKIGGGGFGEVSQSDVPLSWTSYKGADFSCYEVHRSTKPHFSPSDDTMLISYEKTAYNEYLDDSVDRGTTYYYKVVTHTKKGARLVSNQIKATTLPSLATPPAPVTLFTKGPATHRKVVVAWTQSKAVDFALYELHRATTPNFKPSEANMIDYNSERGVTAYEDKDVTPNTAYYYKVVVSNSDGQTKVSPTLRVKTPNKPPLTIPASVVLSAGAPNYAEVPLSWTRSSDTTFDSYELHRDERPNFVANEDTLVDSFSDVKDLAGVDDMADPETTYYYKLVVVNESGGRAPSNEVTVTTGRARPPRPQPAPPLASKLSIGQPLREDSVPLQWTKGGTTAFYRYEIWCSRTPNFNTDQAELAAFIHEQDTLRWVDDAFIFPDSTYYYKLVVVDDTGQKAVSNEVKVITPKTPTAQRNTRTR